MLDSNLLFHTFYFHQNMGLSKLEFYDNDSGFIGTVKSNYYGIKISGIFRSVTDCKAVRLINLIFLKFILIINNEIIIDYGNVIISVMSFVSESWNFMN